MQKYLEIEDQIEVEKRETQKQIDTLEHDNKSLESRIKSYQDHSKCQLSELLFKTFVFKATKSIVSSESLFHFFATLIPTREYSQLSPCRHQSIMELLTITDKVQIPGESYRSLTGNDSCLYRLLLLRNYRHFCGIKMTILLF